MYASNRLVDLILIIIYDTRQDPVKHGITRLSITPVPQEHRPPYPLRPSFGLLLLVPPLLAL